MIVENKSGRSAIKADCVIDCTGDADICQLSGAPTALFPNRNPMAAWYYYLKDGDLQLNSLGARDDHRRCERSVGMFSDWTKRGPVYELPFGALYHPSVPNLLTAGRCLSAADDLWNVTRVIPVCAVSGEAAGTAAALGCDFPALDIAALQETLRAQGVRVHLDEL